MKVLFYIIKNMRLNNFPAQSKGQWLIVYEIIEHFHSFVSFLYFRRSNVSLFLYILCLTMAWNNLVPLISSVSFGR